MSQKKITIATRGSMLALWQARHVEKLLKSQGMEAALNVIATTGDKVQDRFLHEIGGKGLFVKELEEAMLAGDADMAVHSLKDVPVTLPPAFMLGAILPRHAAHDVLILRRKSAVPAGLADLAGKTVTAQDLATAGPITVGTSSLRRSALFALHVPKFKCVPVRGNVDTRLRKLHEGQFDALILAGASLERLGENLWTGLPHQEFIVCKLDPEHFIPCAGQGALAIEVPKTAELDNGVLKWLAPIHCADTAFCVAVERGVLKSLGGDCTMPFGAFCRIAEYNGKQMITARASLLANDGQNASGSVECELDAGRTAESVAAKLLSLLAEQGAAEVLAKLELPVPDTLRLH
ncbi:MAG: hypothetical protein RIQ81_1006 [Pseudomonadota bacterium]